MAENNQIGSTKLQSLIRYMSNRLKRFDATEYADLLQPQIDLSCKTYGATADLSQEILVEMMTVFITTFPFLSHLEIIEAFRYNSLREKPITFFKGEINVLQFTQILQRYSKKRKAITDQIQRIITDSIEKEERKKIKKLARKEFEENFENEFAEFKANKEQKSWQDVPHFWYSKFKKEGRITKLENGKYFRDGHAEQIARSAKKAAKAEKAHEIERRKNNRIPLRSIIHKNTEDIEDVYRKQMYIWEYFILTDYKYKSKI